MKIERTRACLLCVEDDALLCIELEDPVTRKRFWSVPGGEVEDGESPLDAAVRETLEETGYAVVPEGERELVTRYDFRWNAEVFACTTHWFPGRLTSRQRDPVDDAAYLKGCAWIPLDRLPLLLSDHPYIREAVLQVLSAG
jgi:8-oxo-dGTP pyrophosphatase MutT (NUDIX family)